MKFDKIKNSIDSNSFLSHLHTNLIFAIKTKKDLHLNQPNGKHIFHHYIGMVLTINIICKAI